MQTVTELSSSVGVRAACASLGVPRSSFYRFPVVKTTPGPRPRSGRALGASETAALLSMMNSEEFCDKSPRQMWATLLDRGMYLAHWRTMYRILEENKLVRERRDQLRHPAYEKPELLATGPNELWSWDITKLRGPAKWSYYYLYVIMDVFSRFVVGWMIAHRENACLARELIDVTCQRQAINRDELTIHADRGSSMTSKSVGQLMVDLGIEKTHSRPHVPNDNPYSEAQFKTMKYRPDYQKRYGSLMDARAWAQGFFTWYNYEHHHSGIGLMPPAVIHYGQGEVLRRQRGLVLDAAYAAHPERFVRGKPVVPPLPEAVWINKPKETREHESGPQANEVAITVQPEPTSGDGMPEMAEIPILKTINNHPTLKGAVPSKPRA